MDCAVKTCKKASTFLFIVFIETAYACQRKLRLLCLTKIFDVDPTRNYLSFRSTIFISFTFHQPTLLLLLHFSTSSTTWSTWKTLSPIQTCSPATTTTRSSKLQAHPSFGWMSLARCTSLTNITLPRIQPISNVANTLVPEVPFV